MIKCFSFTRNFGGTIGNDTVLVSSDWEGDNFNELLESHKKEKDFKVFEAENRNHAFKILGLR